MNLESKISLFFNNIPLVYDINGNLIEKKRFKEEYNSLKFYLLNNLNSDSVIGIQFDKDYRYFLSILVCMEIGLTYVPLHIDFPQNRIEQIKEISKFELILNNDIYNKALFLDFSFSSTQFEIYDEKILYIMFTSGSTGEPKGVEVKRESYNNFLVWLNEYFSVNNTDTILNTTEFTFDVSLVDVGLTIIKQTSLVFSNFKNNIFNLLHELENYKITTIATVPNNFSMIFTDDLIKRANLSYLKYAFIAGSRFPNSLYHKFQKYLPNLQVYNCYGPTEFTIYCLVKKLFKTNDIINKTVSIGKPILNTKFKVINENNDDVLPFEEGELVVSGIQLMNGYKNRPKKTEDVLINISGELFYRTGDLSFIDDLGNCYVVGRKDDTVKVTGYRVNLSDIDSYIQKLNYVKDSTTICIDDKTDENFLVSYLILDNEKELAEIKNDLKEQLAFFQMPKYIKLIDEFPLNHSGKICKKTLKLDF